MQVKNHVQTLGSVEKTGAEMLRICREYNSDLNGFDTCTLNQFFDVVRSLEYRKDPPGVEHLSRPAVLMTKGAAFRDCDDKALLIGSFLFRKNHAAKNERFRIPWRFVATSSRKSGDLSHVVVEAVINGKPRIIDATYPKNEFYRKAVYTNFKPITGWQNV